MTIKRIVSLIMAALMVFSVFTMTAVAATEACNHHFVRTDQIGTSFVDVGTGHLIVKHYLTVCIHCNAESSDYEYSETPYSHSYSRQDLISQYHMGNNHYYTYLYGCVCGNSYTQTDSEYCGNPCGGIHLSVPDENI